MRQLYPEITPFLSEHIQCQNHQIYVEHIGNPKGIPVVYLHGGPGGGISAASRRYFDPEHYRLIVFDQRGCGRSQPVASLSNNNTSALLDDIEVIRKRYQIEKWLVAGGSWGTTLGLCYAIQYPHRVSAMILRGIFLARRQDIQWFIAPSGGAAQIHPEAYQQFLQPISQLLSDKPSSANDVISLYLNQLTTGCDITISNAAKAWCRWEHRLSSLSEPRNNGGQDSLQSSINQALLECYYLQHQCFIEEDYLVANIDKLKHIPASIIHGRYDLVCKLESAYRLSTQWPTAKLMVIPNAGHSGSEPGIVDAMIKASDGWVEFLAGKVK